MRILLIVLTIVLWGCSSPKHSDQNLNSYFNLSDSLYFKENYWGAIDVLDTILKKDSLNPEAFHRKALCYSNLDLRDDAFKSIDKAIYITRDSSKYYRSRALLFYKYKEIKFAVMDCDYAINALKDTNALLLRAQFNLDTRSFLDDRPAFRSAINDCNTYLALSNNKTGLAEFLKGKAFLRLNELDSAHFYIEKSRLLGYTLSNEEQWELERARDYKKREEEIKSLLEGELKKEVLKEQ